MADDLAAVRSSLTAARWAGQDFDTAWSAALAPLMRSHQHSDAAECVAALSATRESWRCAWARLPAPEHAVQCPTDDRPEPTRTYGWPDFRHSGPPSPS